QLQGTQPPYLMIKGNRWVIRNCIILYGLVLYAAPMMYGQTSSPEGRLPPILMVRGEESYTFLKNNDSTSFFLHKLKWIPLNEKESVALTLGGEYRARLEHFTNEDYTPTNRTYYAQRLSLHAGLRLGPCFRVFTELYHGATSDGEIQFQSDVIDFHQVFLEWSFINQEKARGKLRLGRQEIGLGTFRLVGIREGPNMRRTFDMARLILQVNKASLNLIYGKEVSINFGAFDNRAFLFDADLVAPSLWGVYYQRPLFQGIGKLDLYYLGFYAKVSNFNDVIGEEIRHSIGARSFGEVGNLTYNTEVIVQLGDLAGNQIVAYDLETDWTYQLSSRWWKPRVGLRLDWSSGDRQQGDGRIGTFNPFFVNPAIYSLAAVNTPANILSFHPNLTLYPCEDFSIFMDYALFYRTQVNDGLYVPPRFLSRPADGRPERHVGDVLGVQITYELSRNMTFDVRSSYFIAGRFLEATGPSENTFYVAPTVSLKF
ncbi:MAG: alginate export family protein, partial [Bacteroidota bacterium]